MNNHNGAGTWIAIVVVGLLVWQCSRDNGAADVEVDYSSYNSADVPGTDYSTYGAPPPAYPVGEYRSHEPYAGSGYQDAGAPYGCTDDCRGHDAGWEWAEENGVTSPDDCGGNSPSFEEGCIAYAEEPQAERPDEDRG